MKNKYIVIFVVLLFVTLLPLYPLGKVSVADPKDINDTRIKIILTQTELESILSDIRYKKWGGFYKWVMGNMQQRPIVSISEWELIGYGPQEVFSPSESQYKTLVVYTATKEEVERKKGMLYFFKYIDGAWVFSSEAILSKHENA